MTLNKSKIRCPKCRTVYSIDDGLNGVVWKKSAKCVVCETRFFVENRESLRDSKNTGSGVAFLQTYFEKRGDVARRSVKDRRKALNEEYLTEFEHDIIPIFNNHGNCIIGHISPGRRQKADRRSGIDRRQYLADQDNRAEELFTGYGLVDGSGSAQIDN